MKSWKFLLPVIAFVALGLANADEKNPQLTYYYLTG